MSLHESIAVTVVGLAAVAFLAFLVFAHHHTWTRWSRSHTVSTYWASTSKYPMHKHAVYTRHCRTCGKPQTKEVKE